MTPEGTFISHYAKNNTHMEAAIQYADIQMPNSGNQCLSNMMRIMCLVLPFLYYENMIDS